jgi:hypothetical protein
MYQNARAVQRAFDEAPLNVHTPFRDKLDQFVEGLRTQFDHLDVRIGNEIVL